MINMNIKKQHEIRPFTQRVYLTSPTMHGDELDYIKLAFDTNWVSTVGANIDHVERAFADLFGKQYAVALSSGTAALHMAIRAAAQALYGKPPTCGGSLVGKRVFCSDLTFAATVNPVIYEGGEPILIDSEPDTWNMDPVALERAFTMYPETRIVVIVHLYGTPAKISELRTVCARHGALLIEDAAESLGATYAGRPTGSFGDLGVISFNGNKIITGSCGGMVFTDQKQTMERIRKWSTQSREPVIWYQHEELGYNYRMSNLIAGVIRGQLPYLEAHILEKKRIFQYYQEHLSDLPLSMNPFDAEASVPNHWLSCILIHPEAMCRQFRNDTASTYVHTPGKTCPMEILERLSAINVESRPIWKPMHLQPIYRNYPFVNADGRAETDVGKDIFERGLCLPSDIKMTPEQMDVIIELIRLCFAEPSY